MKQGDRKIALYTIASHPIDTNEFCVGGRDQFVRIYDRRRIASESDAPLFKLCPNHLVNFALVSFSILILVLLILLTYFKTDSSVRAHVTSAVYNFNGAEILASYNDEDVREYFHPLFGDFRLTHVLLCKTRSTHLQPGSSSQMSRVFSTDTKATETTRR